MAILRSFVAIPKNLREWTKWMSGQRFLSVPKTVTTTTHTTALEDVVLVDDDTAGGAVTITLPAAAVSEGIQYQIKKLGTTGAVTIDANAAEKIDGATTKVLSSQYKTITIVCDGTSWHVIDNEATLDILESQITDGTLLSRNASNEIISGTRLFQATVDFSNTAPVTFFGTVGFYGTTPISQPSNITDAVTAHALNATFSDTEVEAALNALGVKINLVLDVFDNLGLTA